MTPSGEKILILDRGNVELAYPREWTVRPDAAGYMILNDPADECRLEVSYMKLPPLLPGAPGVEDLLRAALATEPQAREASPIEAAERGPTRMAWTTYRFVSEDTKGGPKREAFGRWLLASNGLFQVLMTFYYWVPDAAWAEPAWERIVESLHLGDGTQLASPEEHWSLKKPS